MSKTVFARMKEEIDDSPRGIGRSTNRRHVSPVDNEPASISRGTGYTIHRSVLPAVLQPRTKLVTFLVWDSSAVPSGHIFVSFGFPEITTMCKEQCRKEKVVVHAVSDWVPSDRERDNPDTMNHHIGRVGHFFPYLIVREAMLHFNINERDLRYDHEEGRLEMIQRTTQPDSESYLEELRDQADCMIRELFPHIPEDALLKTINHAFGENRKTVGHNQEFPLSKRIQWAVNAYIRHENTNYDSLLDNNIMRKYDARHELAPIAIEYLKKWRGEDGEDEELIEMEWVTPIHETIVVDDDEAANDGSLDRETESAPAASRHLDAEGHTPRRSERKASVKLSDNNSNSDTTRDGPTRTQRRFDGVGSEVTNPIVLDSSDEEEDLRPILGLDGADAREDDYDSMNRLSHPRDNGMMLMNPMDLGGRKPHHLTQTIAISEAETDGSEFAIYEDDDTDSIVMYDPVYQAQDEDMIEFFVDSSGNTFRSI